MEYHYTYRLVCDQTAQYYYGLRTSSKPCEEDPYMSSSRVIKALRSQGYTFKKFLVSYWSSREEAAKHEIDLISKEDVKTNYNCLNLSIPTSTGYYHFGGAPGKRGPQKNPNTSEELRELRSSNRKGKVPWNKGKKTGIGGNTSTRSAMTIERMSKGRSNKFNPKYSCIFCKKSMANNRYPHSSCK
jgi:hypothetical protein